MIAAIIAVGAAAVSSSAVVLFRDEGRSSSPSPSTVTPATVTPSTVTPATAALPASSVPTVPAPPSATATTATTAGDQQASSVVSLSTGVVDIDTVLKYQQAEAAGTGMILSSSGEILTNNHVIAGATSISVTVVTTGKTYTATVVGTDPTHDVAVLQLKGATGLTPARLGDSTTAAVGDQVVAVGNAGGRGGAPTTAVGRVTALGQSITATDETGGQAEQLIDLIQVSASLQPGESGGPLYDASGQVIGMDTAGSAVRRSRTASGQGFAIPINDAVAVVRQIESGTSSGTVTLGTPGFLGIGLQDATAGARAAAQVTQVVAGSPAEKIGLQVGDALTSVAGQPVTSAASVGTALKGHKAGDAIAITWVDSGGATHKATATLIAGPAN